MMNLRDLVEKTPDADLLREMIGLAADRLMALEVGAVTGAGYGEKDPGRPALAPSSCVSRSCGRAATSRASWRSGAWPGRR